MPFVNRVILIGNLTRDPQLSYLPTSTPVCEFSLAINRRWKDQSGQQKEEVCFIDCRAYSAQGELIAKHLTKGRQLYVEGRLKQDTWTAQDGGKRSKLSVVVENFQFMNDRPGGEGGSAGPSRGYEAGGGGSSEGYPAGGGGYGRAAPRSPGGNQNRGPGGNPGYQNRGNYNRGPQPQVESSDPVIDQPPPDDSDMPPNIPSEDDVPF